MSQAILQALAQLDTTNEDHWTSDGLPRMDAVMQLAGTTSLTRDQVTLAAPRFTRSSPELPNAQPAQPVPEPAPEVEPVSVAPESPASVETPALAEEPDALSLLLAERQKATEELEKANQAVWSAQRVAKQAQENLDRVILKIDKERPVSDNQLAIQEYLKRQNEIRLQRHAAHVAAVNSGLDLARLGRAPIDAAMSRRNGRGTQRPVRAL